MNEIFEKHKFIIIGLSLFTLLFALIFIPKLFSNKSVIKEKDVDEIIENLPLDSPLIYTITLSDTITIQGEETATISVFANIKGKNNVSVSKAYASTEGSTNIKTYEGSTETLNETIPVSSEAYFLYDLDRDLNIYYQKDTKNDVWYYSESKPLDDEGIKKEYNTTHLKKLFIDNTKVKYNKTDKKYDCVCSFNATDSEFVNFINDNTTSSDDSLLKTVADIVNTCGSDLNIEIQFSLDKDRNLDTDNIIIDLSKSNMPAVISKYLFPYNINLSEYDVKEEGRDFSITLKVLNKEDVVLPDEVKENALTFEDYLYTYYEADKEILDYAFGKTPIEDEKEEPESNIENNTEDKTSGKFNEDDIFADLYGDDNKVYTEDELDKLREQLKDVMENTGEK